MLDSCMYTVGLVKGMVISFYCKGSYMDREYTPKTVWVDVDKPTIDKPLILKMTIPKFTDTSKVLVINTSEYKRNNVAMNRYYKAIFDRALYDKLPIDFPSDRRGNIKSAVYRYYKSKDLEGDYGVRICESNIPHFTRLWLLPYEVLEGV